MLAHIQVADRAASTRLRALTIREAADHVCVVLLQDLAQDSVQRQVFFASLPHGKCLTVERLIARQALTVERVVQGRLSVINDGYFGDHPDLRGRRQLFWDSGTRLCLGYASGSDADDTIIELGHSRWVNIDDRAGLVFQGSGRAIYRQQHAFPVWRAIEDALILSLQETPQRYQAGEEMARLTAYWCPGQSHQETARQKLILHASPPETVLVEVDGYLCAGNFGETSVVLPQEMTLSAGQPLPLSWGVTGVTSTELRIALQLGAREPMMLALPS
jgi:hypothetical protein